jgi:hypothetical protein
VEELVDVECKYAQHSKRQQSDVEVRLWALRLPLVLFCSDLIYVMCAKKNICDVFERALA